MTKSDPHTPTRRRVLAATAALGLAAPLGVEARTLPQNRPITLVVPFSASGGTDIIARELGKYLGDKLGQPVVVENKGGGGGSIAAQTVARAKPDGHTLLFATSTFITSASSERRLPYDVLKDFTPVALMGRGPLLVVVNKETGITTIQELIARAKARLDALNFVSSGPGSVTQLGGELFKQRTGVQMTHVPYKGSGPATIDLISGLGQVFFSTVPTILSFVRSDKVRLLAVTGRGRVKTQSQASPTNVCCAVGVGREWKSAIPTLSGNGVAVTTRRFHTASAASGPSCSPTRRP